MQDAFAARDCSDNTVSGSVSPAAAEGAVRAIQAFGSGPAVTIRYQNADVVTGDYSLALPVAAPRLGQFTGSLPVTLAAQPAKAGKYSIEASASGYQAQSAEVDVSSAGVSRSFALAK